MSGALTAVSASVAAEFARAGELILAQGPWTTLGQALLLQGGYNAALVAIGAALLGASAGAAGAFLFLRKRALVSDAIAHATLPGIGAAFLLLTALGLDGRFLPALLVGAAVTSAIGLLAIQAMTARTRLREDTAIGAVLSVFFGAGVVLLTIIQSINAPGQAGLEGFLLGATAGMLFGDAVLIACGGALVAALLWLLRRPMTLVAFDPAYAAASGINVARIDLAMMGIALAVTVIGLKIVGLVLIIALLIIPAVAARFWSERIDTVVLGAGAIGAVSGYLGAAISASAPGLPTGPIVVLVAAAIFVISLLCAPARGVLASTVRMRRFALDVHRRQGLLALAHDEPILDKLTLSVLRREGIIRPDGVVTEAGRAHVGKALLDERRRDIVRQMEREAGTPRGANPLVPLEDVLTRDELGAIDAQLPGPRVVK